MVNHIIQYLSKEIFQAPSSTESNRSLALMRTSPPKLKSLKITSNKEDIKRLGLKGPYFHKLNALLLLTQKKQSGLCYSVFTDFKAIENIIKEHWHIVDTDPVLKNCSPNVVYNRS